MARREAGSDNTAEAKKETFLATDMRPSSVAAGLSTEQRDGTAVRSLTCVLHGASPSRARFGAIVARAGPSPSCCHFARVELQFHLQAMIGLRSATGQRQLRDISRTSRQGRAASKRIGVEWNSHSTSQLRPDVLRFCRQGGRGSRLAERLRPSASQQPRPRSPSTRRRHRR
jgi:hypothetical protein